MCLAHPKSWVQSPVLCLQVPATKLDNLSPIPRLHVVEAKTNSHGYPLTFTCAPGTHKLPTLPHIQKRQTVAHSLYSTDSLAAKSLLWQLWNSGAGFVSGLAFLQLPTNPVLPIVWKPFRILLFLIIFPLSQLSSREVTAVPGLAPFLLAFCECLLSMLALPTPFLLLVAPSILTWGKAGQNERKSFNWLKNKNMTTNKPWMHTTWKVWKIPLDLLFKYSIIQSYSNKVKT